MSFGWLGMFRQGAWQEFRSFILQQRRDALKRISVIDAELRRIGYIRVLYRREDPADITSAVTEERVGLQIQENSSLGNLIQAYIAQGGNPFDISMFLSPDMAMPTGDVTETVVHTTDEEGNAVTETVATQIVFEQYPYGGMTWPEGSDPGRGGIYTGGWIPLWRYPPRKLGTNQTFSTNLVDAGVPIDRSREWLTQEIKTLRNDLEARIIKLCDLKEQLFNEKNGLIPQAMGGTLNGVSFVGAVTHHVSSIVDDIDSIFYPDLPDGGGPDFDHPRDYDPQAEYPLLLCDAPTGEEEWTAIG